jgi:hypothetical protein
MSLKLGNTNIAGTQILYSTTGNNTDGAMNQAITTTQLNLKANDADVVHKTGDEFINGVKTFNNQIHFKNSVFVDAASGEEGGEIEFAKAPNSSLTGNVKLDVYKNRMRIFGPASDGITREIINVDIEKNALFVPSSDKTGSAISTVGINKNQNGYVKLGNGIIIQWGLVTNMNNSKATVNYNIPFTATISVVTNPVHSGIADGYSTYVDNVTITSFDVYNKMYGNSANCNVLWIAIGY